jgi:hypothetical protein
MRQVYTKQTFERRRADRRESSSMTPIDVNTSAWSVRFAKWPM